MKRKKKIRSLILSVIVLCVLCACSAKSQQQEPDSEEPQNSTVEVFDKAGKKLGEIAQNGSATLYDAGILYTSAAQSGETQYRLFSPEQGRDTLLGTLADQSYEASFARQELKGKIYTLAMTGNLYDSKPDPLWLLELDPQGGMKTYKISENGFPYAGMCACGGRLLIFFHDQGEAELCDRVMEFDPQKGALSEVLSFTLQNELRGDTLRALCEENGQLWLLRLHFESETELSLWLDSYDVLEYTDEAEGKRTCEKTAEREITGLFRAAVEGEGAVAEDALNEMKQSVSFFDVYEGRYLWLENFSITHFLADLEEERIFPESDSMLCAVPGGAPLFYRSLAEIHSEDSTVFELRGGRLEGTELTLPGEGKSLLFFCRAPSGATLAGITKGDKAYEFYMAYDPAETSAALDMIG